MQPARFREADFLLVEIDNAKSTSPAVPSGEERGLLSRSAAGNRASLSVVTIGCRSDASAMKCTARPSRCLKPDHHKGSYQLQTL